MDGTGLEGFHFARDIYLSKRPPLFCRFLRFPTCAAFEIGKLRGNQPPTVSSWETHVSRSGCPLGKGRVSSKVWLNQPPGVLPPGFWAFPYNCQVRGVVLELHLGDHADDSPEHRLAGHRGGYGRPRPRGARVVHHHEYAHRAGLHAGGWLALAGSGRLARLGLGVFFFFFFFFLIKGVFSSNPGR